MKVFEEYLAELKKNLAHGDATEHTHRPALKKFLESVGDGITATNEPKRVLCGAPDFNITKGKVPLGHVETKDIGENLPAVEKGRPPHGEQFLRYRDGLPNWILTDYLEFRWYVNGEHRLTGRLAELDGDGKLKGVPDGEEEVANLLEAFFSQKALTIGTAKELAHRLAGMTRIIRDLITNTFEHEIEKGFLHTWLAAFRETLIPDLGEAQFADMFAQTLAYGLFAARVHTPQNKPFSRQMAAFELPKTNPFLRKLFSEIAGVDMPETIAWAVDDIVELLNHTDLATVLENFGKGKGKKDPVVHFYEDFLRAYDPKMREVRGVYYTPEPVVSYIVRSIDHLLKTRFNRAKGLADENTLILDPATGTATFLYFVIAEIFQTFAAQRGAWDGYVEKYLLNRIFGFELLMAPYAIAHLKLGMQLQELGYTFGSNQRLGIYLTNTLELAAKKSEQLIGGWISDEANAAAKIKKDDPILVVLGNPPYSGQSANRSTEVIKVQKGDRYLADFELSQGKINRVMKTARRNGEVVVPNFIGELMTDYYVVDGAWLDEKNPKWLQNDYVKFIRFAQWRIDKTGEGIVGYITAHSYLDNATFCGMRQHLMETFNEIYVYDLHGNPQKEKSPDGSKDENVFDITQGVAIIFCVKQKGKNAFAQVHHAELWGPREIYDGDTLAGGKYHELWSTTIATTEWVDLKPTSPFYLFKPYATELLPEYEQGWKVTDCFVKHTVGIITKRDKLAIRWTNDDVWEVVSDFVALPPEEARAKYKLPKDVRDWKVDWAQRDLRESGPSRENIVPVYYRPFDVRYTYYTGKSRGFLGWPFEKTMRHMLAGNNVALITSRLTKGETFRHTQATRNIAEVICMSSKTSNNGFVFPLYLRPETKDELTFDKSRRPNFTAPFLKALAEKLNLPQAQPHELPSGITPEDIFNYAYAILHSPTYRLRYAEYLKLDFPRLPLTSELKLFRAIAEKGEQLVAMHLLESPKLAHFTTEFPVRGSNKVDRVQYTASDEKVWMNSKQYFGPVPIRVWEFCVGGYQVCEKWLKDRKSRELSYDDIQRYQKIIVALNETIRIMNEIDKAIPEWPIN